MQMLDKRSRTTVVFSHMYHALLGLADLVPPRSLRVDIDNSVNGVTDPAKELEAATLAFTVTRRRRWI